MVDEVLKEFKGVKVVLDNSGDIIITIHKATFLEELELTEKSQYCLKLTAQKRTVEHYKYTHCHPTSKVPRSLNVTAPTQSVQDEVDKW